MGKINYYLHRMQSIHRALISVCIFLLIYFISPIKTIPLLNLMLCWFGFCLSYVFISWYIFYTTPISTIARKAQQEDGSRLISSKDKQLNDAYIIIICMLAMLASWILVHTIYTFHYARLYYEHNAGGTGLEFPGDDQPDYLDFAYFSFVMGCTFQVSDVGVSSKKIRRVALFHGLLSFALNTFVVALTINIISGLIN